MSSFLRVSPFFRFLLFLRGRDKHFYTGRDKNFIQAGANILHRGRGTFFYGGDGDKHFAPWGRQTWETVVVMMMVIVKRGRL